MTLSAVNANLMLGWTLSRANTGYQSTTEGPDSLNFSLTGISTGTFNQIYTTQLSLAASGSTTVNLTSLTNLVYESFGFGHVLSLMVEPTGCQVTVQPGASNPCTWFMPASGSVTVKDGGCLFFSDSATATGTAVASGSCNLAFQNNGATSGTVLVGVLGGTT